MSDKMSDKECEAHIKTATDITLDQDALGKGWLVLGTPWLPGEPFRSKRAAYRAACDYLVMQAIVPDYEPELPPRTERYRRS